LNPHTSYPPYPPQYQGGFGGPFIPPSNSVLARARSINTISNTDLYGSQHVGLNDSPNSGSFSAFTPPQAYQQLGYADRPPSQPNGPRDFVPSMQLQNGRSSQISLPDVPPKIGLSVERDNGTLDLDFHGAASELEADEASSELPWARMDSSSL
jgi:hypothetical protein